MSHLEEDQTELGNHEELIFPCLGRDGDYLRVTWDEDDPEWRLLWIEAYPSPSIRDRIKSAVRTLKGLTPNTGVLLSKDSVRSLQNFLKSKMAVFPYEQDITVTASEGTDTQVLSDTLFEWKEELFLKLREDDRIVAPGICSKSDTANIPMPTRLQEKIDEGKI